MYQYDSVLRYAGSEPTSTLNWLTMVAPSEAVLMVVATTLSLGGAGSILSLGHQWYTCWWRNLGGLWIALTGKHGVWAITTNLHAKLPFSPLSWATPRPTKPSHPIPLEVEEHCSKGLLDLSSVPMHSLAESGGQPCSSSKSTKLGIGLSHEQWAMRKWHCSSHLRGQMRQWLMVSMPRWYHWQYVLIYPWHLNVNFRHERGRWFLNSCS